MSSFGLNEKRKGWSKDYDKNKWLASGIGFDVIMVIRSI